MPASRLLTPSSTVGSPTVEFVMVSPGGGGIDPNLVQFLQKLESVRHVHIEEKRKTMREEVRSVEFWRAVISECLATFFCVFLVCGAHVPWPGYDPSQLSVALTSGFAMATLTQCFGPISGGHVNPAVTFAMLVTRKVTPLGAVLYVTAQCGGAIAGCALLFGVSIPGHQGSLGSTTVHTGLTPWQGFGIELVLTFIVVFAVFACLDSQRKIPGGSALSIGAAYLTCSLAGLPSTGAAVNPARALGPAFVMNRWKYHWVYWFAPMSGGLLAGLLYEYVFDPRKTVKYMKDTLEDLDRESSMHSQDDDYDEPGKTSKYGGGGGGGSTYRSHQHLDNTYRPALPAPSNPASANYTPSITGGSTYGNVHGNGSIYDAAPYRPPSATSTYASIHGGSRMGSLSRAPPPQRMEYGPGATKF